MLVPWIVTSATCPRLTSFRKSENARVACGPRLDEVWNRLKSATRSSPITIQRARFLPKLFTAKALPCRAEHRAPFELTPTGGDPRQFLPDQEIRRPCAYPTPKPALVTCFTCPKTS